MKNRRWSIILVLATLLGLPLGVQAQYDLYIRKVAGDSVQVVFDKNLRLHTDSVYAFMILTNFLAEDQVYENLTDEPIEDGKIIQAVFREDEFLFSVYTLGPEKQRQILQEHLLLIRGTRFEVTVDGQPVRRHLPGSIRPSSRIAIRLVSERHKAEELSVVDPVVISWQQDQRQQQAEPLQGQALSFSVSQLAGLVPPSPTAPGPVFVTVLLPQVFDLQQNPLLPEDARNRTLTLQLVE
jgi:hypothetical protein